MNKNDLLRESLMQNFSGKLGKEIYRYASKRGFRDFEEQTCSKYLKKNDKILDLGCGSGRLAFALCNQGYKKITGADLIPEMIELAKDADKDKNIKFIVGDATQLDFDDESFDAVVFTHNGWSQIPGEQNKQKALQEVSRILKKDGIFIFSFFVWKHSPFYYWKLLKYHLAKILNIPIWEMEFGDVMLYTYEDYKKKWCMHLPRLYTKSKPMKLFIHYKKSLEQVIKMANKEGFSLLESIKEYESKNLKQYRIILKKY